MDRKCMYCEFWEPNEKGLPEDKVYGSYDCRRRSPRVKRAWGRLDYKVAVPLDYKCWPKTGSDDWCGDFVDARQIKGS